MEYIHRPHCKRVEVGGNRHPMHSPVLTIYCPLLNFVTPVVMITKVHSTGLRLCRSLGVGLRRISSSSLPVKHHCDLWTIITTVRRSTFCELSFEYGDNDMVTMVSNRQIQYHDFTRMYSQGRTRFFTQIWRQLQDGNMTPRVT